MASRFCQYRLSQEGQYCYQPYWGRRAPIYLLFCLIYNYKYGDTLSRVTITEKRDNEWDEFMSLNFLHLWWPKLKDSSRRRSSTNTYLSINFPRPFNIVPPGKIRKKKNIKTIELLPIATIFGTQEVYRFRQSLANLHAI